MSSISRARISYVDVSVNRILHNAPLVSAAGVRKIIRLFAVCLGAASLAACAQSSVFTQKTELPAAIRKASLEHNRKVFATNRYQGVNKKHTPFASDKSAAELTAAHRTLPFGTRLRVTNVATGQSATVRVNDRGPFIPGRIVDVSYSAATTLGMVGGGIAKVKLEVVE